LRVVITIAWCRTLMNSVSSAALTTVEVAIFLATPAYPSAPACAPGAMRFARIMRLHGNGIDGGPGRKGLHEASSHFLGYQ
jgi:hypothetical protein